MDTAADLASGKGARDENFPVASFLLKAEYRAPVMGFYHFARAADDIADHSTALPEKKIEQLNAMRRGLQGATDGAEEALALRHIMADRGLDPAHANDLLNAFEQDVTVCRYSSWGDLIDYCRLSAMQSGASCLMCMARIGLAGRHPMHSVRHCR